MEPADLLIFDKDPVTNSALEVLLSDDERLSVKGTARSEDEALRFLEERDIDVVLMDINVNNKTYYRPLQRLKKRLPDQKVLTLLYEEPEVLEGVLKYGADGYFFKDRDLGMLPDALEKVAKEGSFRPSSLDISQPSPEGVLSFQGDQGAR